MEKISTVMKEEAKKDLEMYFGKPPYDDEYIRHHLTSGLFEQQALAKYGRTPIELMQELKMLRLSEKMEGVASWILESKEWVVKAIAFYKKVGQTIALAEFSNSKGSFVKDDKYVFVLNLKGTMLAHGANEKYVGQNWMDVQDPTGKKFIQEIIKSALSRGSGWVEYEWHSPVTKDYLLKHVYFEKVDDLIICSGVYKEMWQSRQ
ncbi:MAG TPA: cache domain-containing protein [Syntrophales bacterium]|nr:cache domain-containing protein [Syntrophales bacterium]